MPELEDLLKDGKWEAVLEAYGTPGNFADSTYVRLLPNEENPEDIPLRVVVAPGYANRGALMAKQKEETEARKSKGEKPRWENDGNTDCFLCDNVGQAKDIGNNVLLPYDAYSDVVLLPNKYPAFKGHMLSVEKPHQQGTLKLTPSLLETSVELAEKYGVIILRNHPKAGMSIPGHDHFQSYPKIVATTTGEKTHFTGLADCSLLSTKYGEDVFRLTRTRFDTIAFKGKKALETFFRTVGKLEQNDKIFTCFYEPNEESIEALGTFFLNPHKAEVKGVGGHAWYHPVVTPEQNETLTYEGFFELPSQGIYGPKEFDWGKYF